MLIALVLLYQTATAAPTAPSPTTSAAQAQIQTQAKTSVPPQPTQAASDANKPPEKPVCHKEFSTGSRVRTETICTTDKMMERNQREFERTRNTGATAPIP